MPAIDTTPQATGNSDSSLAQRAVLGVPPPAAYGPVPSSRQLAWHARELYGFIHFTINTFTDAEWGYGDEDSKLFCPTDFDAKQIVATARAGGLAGLILTCKHHDGFCLWPSKFTEHSVRHSLWENGKGDLVRSLSDACARQGLKFGIYLSPWDRHHSEYGRPAYVEYFRSQLIELLTNYGPIFEVWFDGANGGDGYYGGAREKRAIGGASYYRWDEIWAVVRELQPEAVIFGDEGPDVRWVGNERGQAGNPCWATYTPSGHARNASARRSKLRLLGQGDRHGTSWVPAEADVSLRPGWFYHAAEDRRVKTSNALVSIYYASVGHGAAMLLNLSPDRRGRIHETDVEVLSEFRQILDGTFQTNLARAARISSPHVRGGSDLYAPSRLCDDSGYYCTDDAVKTTEVVFDFDEPVTFNVVSLREYLPLGLRVDEWALDRWVANRWQRFGGGVGIGSRRLWRGVPVTSNRVRLRVIRAAACPALSELGLHLEPEPKHLMARMYRRVSARLLGGPLGRFR